MDRDSRNLWLALGGVLASAGTTALVTLAVTAKHVPGWAIATSGAALVLGLGILVLILAPVVIERVSPDHVTLWDPMHGGWMAGVAQGGASRFYAGVGCAPSRRLAPRRRQLTSERARRFVDEVAPGLFPDPPTYSSAEGVHYEINEVDGNTTIARAWV